MVEILLTALAVSGKPALSFSSGSNMPSCIAMSLFGSEMMGKGKLSAGNLLYACISFIQLLCESTGSQERAMHFTLRLENSGTSDATAPSSVVHTGVKSAGCENRIPHL